MALSPFDPLALTRWDPFEEMTSLREAMDRLFETSIVRPTRALVAERPLVDMSETDNEYIIRASLPGFRPEDVKISVQADVLTLEGERSEERERREGERKIYQERRFGRFCRSFRLPIPVEAEKAEAHFEHGILQLTLPKSTAARPKEIKIVAAGARLEGEKVREAVEAPKEVAAS